MPDYKVLDKKFFWKIGPEVVAKFKKHIFIQGKDAEGNKFKPYSTRPSKWVSMSMKESAKHLIPKE